MLRVEQKTAMFCSLGLISSADEVVRPKDMDYIKSIANLLGLSLEPKVFEAASDLPTMGANLDSLCRSDKEWFIGVVYGLLVLESPTSMKKCEVVSEVFKQLNLSDKEIMDAMNKHEALQKMFLK